MAEIINWTTEDRRPLANTPLADGPRAQLPLIASAADCGVQLRKL